MKTIVMLPIERLHPHPDNPRKNLGELDELAESILKNGIMQNLTVVRDGEADYTVIIGHRRLGAAKKAGLSLLPCAITEMSPTEQIATMLLENVQRVELTPFEQMKGFQQLLDLGETVETISQKTGFSASTVRRRIKLTELDEKKLSEAMTRQVSLTDLAKLEEIKDKRARNRCLAAAGTEDFERIVRGAKVEQRSKENRKPMLAELNKYAKESKGRPNDYNYYSWESFSGYTPGMFSKLPKGEYIYIISSSSGVQIYKKSVTAKKEKEKKSKSQLEREKHIRECESQLAEDTSTAYELRREFIKTYVASSTREQEIYKKCAEMVILQGRYAGYFDAVEFFALYDKKYSWDESDALYTHVLSNGTLLALIKCIASRYDRKNAGGFYQTMHDDYPKHCQNPRLKCYYDFLCFLGYKMSEAEMMLINGTHPAFKKEKDNETQSD
ncbi:MAG: ParB/RepB/Spo0J family partition protein [Clostridia bacterium]|nr:ParB/RepB/Spo0J family partition protein [Clostridia bacterium]